MSTSRDYWLEEERSILFPLIKKHQHWPSLIKGYLFDEIFIHAVTGTRSSIKGTLKNFKYTIFCLREEPLTAYANSCLYTVVAILPIIRRREQQGHNVIMVWLSNYLCTKSHYQIILTSGTVCMTTTTYAIIVTKYSRRHGRRHIGYFECWCFS